MSDQDHAADSFNAELARKSTIQTRVNQIVKSLPVQPQADYPREEVINHLISKLEENVELSLTDRNWLVGRTKNGAAADLTPLVQDQLLLSKYIDGESVTKAINEGKLELGAKDELRTTAAKVAFISKYGEQAYARLPLHRQPKFDKDPATMTRQQYLSLPISERCKFNETEVHAMMSRK